MTVTRGVAAVWCLALATCCPTLWIQVTKTDPAPWPELPTPVAFPPAIPSAMPNRFDVLEGGALTRKADGYRDIVDARDDAIAQQTTALTALEAILHDYGDTRLAACADGALVKAEVSCTKRGNCQALIVDAVPAAAKLVIAGRQARVIEANDDWHSTQRILKLSERIDAEPRATIDVCFVDQVELSRPLLSFVHASDIQLRDPSVVLTDRRLSERLDWFEPLASFEYDEDMAFYNQYLMEAMVATINAAAGENPRALERDKPSFVIHTGDSIDSNMMSELHRFHTVIDRLRIPFYELFGNHDILVFGNLTPTDTRDNDKQCSPVAALIGAHTSWAPNKICVDQLVKRCPTCTGGDVELVASATGHHATRQRFMDQLAHDAFEPVAEPAAPEPGVYCKDTRPGIANGAYTRAHGFDLGTEDDRLDGARLGYYAFVEPLPDDKHAVFVALDGEELPDHEGGIYGRVGHEQLAWLQRVMACVKADHPHDLVFVFAHQPLSMLKVDAGDPAIEQVLDDAGANVAGFFYGHHHKHGICRDERTSVCSKFWEIETGSLVEFPQEARMVRLKQVGQQLAFLEVSTFGENLADPNTTMAKYVELARRGAERDHCKTYDARCSSDLRVYREDGNHTAARLFFKLP